MGSNDQSRRSPDQFVDDIKAILNNNVSRSVHLMARINTVAKSKADAIRSRKRQPVDKTEALEKYLKYNITSYEIISNHLYAMVDKLVSLAEGSMVDDVPVDRGDVRALDLRLQGRPGEQIGSAFLVHNHHAKDFTVTFEATPFTAPGVPPVDNDCIRFDPASCRVKAGEQVVVKFTVDVNPSFQSGNTYLTRIRLLGFAAKEVVAALEVLPPAAGVSRERPVKKRSTAAAAPPTRKQATGAAAPPTRTRAKKTARGKAGGTGKSARKR